VTLNLVVDAHTSSSERVVPLLTDAGSYLALVPLGVVVFLLFGLLPGARPKLAERRDKLRHWALHAVAVVVALGVALALLVTHPGFPLGPSLVDHQRSPDGSKTGYLYRSCFMGAHLGVFVRDGSELTMHRVESIRRDSCEDGVRVRWVGNEVAEAVDGMGQRLVDVAPPQMHLNLGPH